MYRAVHAVLTLVLFTAAMEGLNYLASDGVSEPFGVGFCFGLMLAVAVIVFVIDRDECPPWANAVCLALIVFVSALLGKYFDQLGLVRDLIIGPIVGFGIMFPLTYWANGQDRAKRGNPRPPISWRWSAPEAQGRRRSTY